MSAVLPTPDEYARMSWRARMAAAKRARAAELRARRRDRFKAEAVLIAKATRTEAERILAGLPRDPDAVIAERLAIASHYDNNGRGR